MTGKRDKEKQIFPSGQLKIYTAVVIKKSPKFAEPFAPSWGGWKKLAGGAGRSQGSAGERASGRAGERARSLERCCLAVTRRCQASHPALLINTATQCRRFWIRLQRNREMPSLPEHSDLQRKRAEVEEKAEPQKA